jgi:hypothetical protein
VDLPVEKEGEGEEGGGKPVRTLPIHPEDDSNDSWEEEEEAPVAEKKTEGVAKF